MTSIKRIFVTLLCCVAVLAMCAVSFAAGTNVSSRVSASEVKVGDTVTVSVSLSNATISSLGVDVIAPATFEVVSGSWVPDGPLRGFDMAKNKGAFAFASATQYSGEIFKLTLKAKTAGTSAQSVSVKVVAKNGANTVFTETTNASIKVICATHTFGEYTKTADKHERTCTACGFKESVKHTWDAGKVTKSPSCTEKGEKTYTCTTCKHTKVESIATVSHTYGAWTKVDNNKHQHKCSICGATETANHKFDAGKVTTAPTCGSEGVKTYTCSDCGATKTESIARPAHTYTNDCDTSCNSCGATRTTSHKYDAKWTSDAKYHWHVCSVCGNVQEKIAHTASDWIVKTQPSSMKAGKKVKECTVCKKVLFTETIPATGCKHDKGTSLQDTKEATCTEAGYTGDEVCNTCSTVIKKGDVIAAKGHDVEVKNAKEATCQQEGYTGDEICKVCGETVKKGETISKTEHNLTVVDAKDASCTAEGFTGHTVCQTCNERIKEGTVIPKLAHDYQNGVCKNCGEHDPNYTAPKKTNAIVGGFIVIGVIIALVVAAPIILFVVLRKKRNSDGEEEDKDEE